MADHTVLRGGDYNEQQPEWGAQLVTVINACLQGGPTKVNAFEYTTTLLRKLDQALGSRTVELSDTFWQRITIGNWGNFVFPPFPTSCPVDGNFSQYLIDKFSHPQNFTPVNDPRSVIAAVVIFFAPHLTPDQRQLQIKLAARDNLRAGINAMLTQTGPELNAIIGAGLVRGLVSNVVDAHALSTGLPSQYRAVFPLISSLIEYQAGMLADAFTQLQNRSSKLKDHPCALIPGIVEALRHQTIGDSGTLFDEMESVDRGWQRFKTGLASEKPSELLDNELRAHIRAPELPAAVLFSDSVLEFPEVPQGEISKTREAEWRAALGQLPRDLRKQIVRLPNSFRPLTLQPPWTDPVDVAHELAGQRVIEFWIGGTDPSAIPSCFEDKSIAEIASRVLGNYPKIVPSSVLKLNIAAGADLKDILRQLAAFMRAKAPISDEKIKKEIPVCSTSIIGEDREAGKERLYSVLGFLRALYVGGQSVSLVADHELPCFLERVAKNGFLFRPESPNNNELPTKVILERNQLADPSEILRLLREIWLSNKTLNRSLSKELALRIFTEIVAPQLAQSQPGDVLKPFDSGSTLVGWKAHAVLKIFDTLELLRSEDRPEPPQNEEERPELYILEIPPSDSQSAASPSDHQSLLLTS